MIPSIFPASKRIAVSHVSSLFLFDLLVYSGSVFFFNMECFTNFCVILAQGPC